MFTSTPDRARVLRWAFFAPWLHLTMSAGPAAPFGTPAPSVLKCSPHGTLREDSGATAPAGKGQGHPRNLKASRLCLVLTLHPHQPGDLAGPAWGQRLQEPGALCSCCPEGLLGNLQRPPQGLFSNALVLLKRDTQSRDGAGSQVLSPLSTRGVTAPSSPKLPLICRELAIRSLHRAVCSHSVNA